MVAADYHDPGFLWQFAKNLLERSLAFTLGWDSFSAPLLRNAHLPLAGGLTTIVSLAILAVWIAHFRRHPLQARLRSFAGLLLLPTAALWLSLIVATAAAGQQWDFSSQTRLHLPITLMWLLLCAASLDAQSIPAMFRSPAFYMLAVPLALTAGFALKVAATQRSYPAMPRSALPGHNPTTPLTRASCRASSPAAAASPTF